MAPPPPRRRPLEWLREHHPGRSVRDFLEEFYVERGLSSSEIARISNCGTRAWLKHIKKSGLTRSLSDARRRYWSTSEGQRVKRESFKRVWTNNREPRGQITALQRRILRKRQNHECPICEQPLKKYHVRIHHVRPVVLGGADDLSNLVALCYRCHDLIHMGDIETVAKLGRSFHRCLLCGESLEPEDLRVHRQEVAVKRNPHRTQFVCFLCETCFADLGTGDLHALSEMQRLSQLGDETRRQ